MNPTRSTVSTGFSRLDPDLANYIPLFQYRRSTARSPFGILFFCTLHSIFQNQDPQSTDRHEPGPERCILELKVPKLYFFSCCRCTGRCIPSNVIVATPSTTRGRLR